MKSVERIREGRERRSSTGCLEEYGKRKREMSGEEGGSKEEIFKRSIRTTRSPPRGEDREEEMVGRMNEWKEEIKRELREGMRGVKEEIRKIAEEQKEELKREMEGLREELAVKDEMWRREREEMRVRMQKMERELEGLRGKAGRGKEDTEERAEREEARGKKEEWIRIKALERKWERKERDGRRKNILIKGLKVGEEELKERVEEILEGVGGDIKVEEVKNIQAGKTEKGRLVVVRLMSEDMRRRVLRNKGKLKGGEIWIEEDLTWEERKKRWKIRRIAREEEVKGKRVRVNQEGVWIEGLWWGWDEEVEGLRDERGRIWGEEEKRKIDSEEEGRGERRRQTQGEC